MSDTWGLEQFPAQAWDTESAPGDKAITLIGAALQAAINADLGTLWGAIAPGSLPVAHVFTWDPKHKFHENKLPALYIFEQSSTTDVTSDDLDMDTRTLAVYWVARMSSPKHETLRETARHYIGKVVTRLCRYGRHPAWVDGADTDTEKSRVGSYLPKIAGLNSMVRLQATPLELTIELPGESGKIESFRGWASQIRITEIQTLDPALGVVANTGEGEYETNGDPETTVTQQYP